MESDVALNALQKHELMQKFTEIGKVHLTWAILKNVDMVVQRVVFLHEELMKLPSFPRKAMDSNMDLYKGGELGKVCLYSIWLRGRRNIPSKKLTEMCILNRCCLA